MSYRLLGENTNNSFFVDNAIVYMHYEDGAVTIDRLKIKDKTLGLLFTTGCDLQLTENLFLGFQMDFLF